MKQVHVFCNGLEIGSPLPDYCRVDLSEGLQDSTEGSRSMSSLSRLFGRKKEQGSDKTPGPSPVPPSRPSQVSPSGDRAVYSPGDVIANRYEAVKVLTGGMGIVYLCLDRQEDRPVALKTFKPEYLPNRAARDRFLREGTVWVDLGRHPHIVRAYRVERVGDGRETYLVLEWVTKEQGYRDASLRSRLVPGRPLSVEQSLLFALQVVRGMAHATTTIPGLVHRDLKPENVLVGSDRLLSVAVNRLRVTDFGLARVLESGLSETSEAPESLDVSRLERTHLTRGIVGTPPYMAPEQWQGRKVSMQTDMYALGCILYEMLTGQRAVAGHSFADLKRAHCRGEIRPLPDSLPETVVAVVTHCLAQEPEERYACWDELEAALAATYEEVTGKAVPGRESAQALARAERVAVGWSHSAMGRSYLDIGKAKVALGYFERVREIGQREKERFLEADGLNNLGGAHDALGDVRRAIRFYEQALEILRELGGKHGEGLILSNLGYAYRRLGNTQRAIELFERQLAVYRELGERYGESVALSGLGLTYAELGEAQKAIEFYRQSLSIDREIGHRVGEGADLGNLGEAHLQLGNMQQATACFEQALAIAREVGDRSNEGNVLGGLGNVYFRLHEERRAITYFEQALAVQREIGDRHGEGVTLGNLGNAYANSGDAQRAISYYKQALAILKEGEDVAGFANLSFNLAIVLIRQECFADALPYAERAVHGFARVGHAQAAEQAEQLAAQIRAVVHEEGRTVDAMIGVCVHSPDTWVNPPSDVRQWAVKVLSKRPENVSLSSEAKVGFLMTLGTSGFEESEKSAWKDLPGHMRTFMGKHGLDSSAYELQSFSEDLRSDLKILCMIAIRK
jgi:tetratricopeptide (TPR) repeat protein